jgi:3-phenylpropionate/trans-cinnamate dioxygenase ferredoxin subunit
VIRVAAAEEIPAGTGVMVSRAVAGTMDDIAVLCDEDGSFHAVNDTCTHSLASLSRGFVEGGCVVCPLHGARFDLRTGRELSTPAFPATQVHRVLVRAGVVYVCPEPAALVEP